MSTLFYLEKGCASIENAEKFSKKCGFYGLHALGSGCWLEGSPFLRGLRQIDSSSLKFAELVENGAKIADLVRHFVSSAEFNLVAVVIPDASCRIPFRHRSHGYAPEGRCRPIPSSRPVQQPAPWAWGRRQNPPAVGRGNEKAVDVRIFIEGGRLDALKRLAAWADRASRRSCRS